MKFIVKWVHIDGSEHATAPFESMHTALKWTHDALLPRVVTGLIIEPVPRKLLTIGALLTLLKKCHNDFLYRNVIDTDTGAELTDSINLIEGEITKLGKGALIDHVILQETD